MRRISVVMPVYGQWHLAKRNIDSLLYFDKQSISEIIIVDDCSPEPNPFDFDSSIIQVLKNDYNLGYTGTVNAALKKASSEIVLLLDSDAYLIDSILQKIIAMYEADPLLGSAGYSTVDDSGQHTGSFCYEPMSVGLVLGQQLEAKLGRFIYYKKKNIIPYSCAVSFRKACLEEMGYFDQNLFPVLDADLDLSMRIHRSKWKLVFNEKILLSHSGGNFYKINYKRVLLFYKSRWILLKKHNLIKHPQLVKDLIKARLKLELIILKVLAFLKKGDLQIHEKKKGRELIIQEVSSYMI